MAQEERARRRAARERPRGRYAVSGRRLALVLLCATSAAVVTLGTWRLLPARDPTRYGPARWIALREFIATDGHGGQSRLFGAGETNLPDQAKLTVTISASDELIRASAVCISGRFEIAQVSTGLVTQGSYQVRAVFVLEEQSRAVREALHYQPRFLEARGQLTVRDGVDASRVRSELRALIDKANNNHQREVLAACSASAKALEERLWISTLVPATRRLRGSLRQALSSEPLDLERLRHDLVAAEVLSSR